MTSTATSTVAAAPVVAAPASSLCFVYINNERVELLEDRRLYLFGKFPETTTLVDPSFMPPRPVPLSTLEDERGVTARKLVPNAHYHAFRVDPNSGERIPVNVAMRYLVVHNLPSNATAELIGKYFEQFDFIVESDIIKPPGQPGVCKGRGYVQFSNPETVRNVLKEYRTLQLSSTITVWLDYSDVKPRGSAALPPPQYQAQGAGVTGGSASAGPASPASTGSPLSAGAANTANSGATAQAPQGDSRGVANRPQVHHHHHHHHQHHHHAGPGHHHSHGHHSGGAGSILPAPAPPAAVATGNSNTYFFVTHIYEEHIATSTRDGIFWPTKVNQRTFYQPLEMGGQVYLLFLLMNRPVLFGYARVTYRDMVRNKSANFTLEWLKHSVYLTEAETSKSSFPPVQLWSMTDGTPLKQEVGQAVCDFLDGQPSRDMPANLPNTNNASPTNANTGPNNNSSAPTSQQQRTVTSNSPTTIGAPSSFVPQPRSAQSPTSQGTPLALPRSLSNGTFGGGLPAGGGGSSNSLSSMPSSPHHHQQHHHHHHHHHHHQHHQHHQHSVSRPLGAAPPQPAHLQQQQQFGVPPQPRHAPVSHYPPLPSGGPAVSTASTTTPAHHHQHHHQHLHHHHQLHHHHNHHVAHHHHQHQHHNPAALGASRPAASPSYLGGPR